ncbi:MAG: PKD domain-containing protein, partial [Ferruginibacter sp.]
DPASGANNTSAIANPTHNYTNTGSYTVTLSVTNTNGCTDTKTVTTTFSVTPALAYPALTAVCESVSGTVSVATATVTNGVSGTGVYSGPGTNAAGQFNPSTAGAGTHTITYTFTSTGGCSATITSTIVVDPKPTASFTITNAICEGAAASIQDNSSISSGSIAEWRWNFGDGTPPVTYNNNNPFTHTYTTYGTKTVTLVTVSSKGCISVAYTQTVTVSAVPVADFSLPASVCMPGGIVNITNRSATADGSALTYSWDFGDGTPASTAVNPSHTYTAIGSYNITLTVTGGGGCIKDTVKTFSAFFDKPVAAFTVSPDVLCQGTPNVFTDASTAPNSSIAAYTWNFGDGSATSSQANPTKIYSKPGIFDVTLTVTSNEGCVSDAFSAPVTVYLQPVVDAGPSFVVPQGTLIQFKPSANDSSVTSFTWSPATGLNNPGILRPVLTANVDQVYTLTAMVGGLCTASDTLYVKILRPVVVPNAFSPNGDGTNDTWIIENLSDYAGAVVEVYNRYGQMVYTSRGYSVPWEGASKGKPLPVATYYYIIQLNNGFKPLNGSVTIIR